MDLQTMIKRVATYTRLQDSSGNFLSSKNVTSTDVTNWLNDRYLEDIFPEFADHRPNFFSQEGYADNYAATGAVSASSTSTTLVASTAIFTSNMVGAVILNSTDSAVAKITSYTNTTTVTLDTTIGDDWDGDTIYVFTGIYTFGGDSTDIFKPIWVGVKYSSSDDDYTRAIIANDRDLYNSSRGIDRNALFSQSGPRYTFETVDVSGTPTSAISIKPINWVEPVTNGIYLRYIERPAALSSNTDVPRLPLGFHKLLVEGAVADTFFTLENPALGNVWETKYQMSRKKLMATNIAEREHRTVDFMRRASDFNHNTN